VFVRVGRALGIYGRQSTSESSEFDTPTFDGLISSATGRLTTATGGQPGASASQSGTTTVKTAQSSTLGTIVVDSNGKTVYTLANNGQQVPCPGACLTVWPAIVLPAGATTATGSGVNNVGTTMTGALQQVTVNGAPVYTFSGDSKAGDANGEG